MTFRREKKACDWHLIALYPILESPIKSKDLDLSQYSMKQLSPDYRLHWRILKDKNEIEFVAVVNGTSWVGLGWRPRKLNATCRNFPLLQSSTPSEKLVTKTAKVPSSEPEPTTPEPEHAAAEPSAEKSPKSEPGKLNEIVYYYEYWQLNRGSFCLLFRTTVARKRTR